MRSSRKRWVWGLAALLALLLVGGWSADRALKARKHPGLGTFVRQVFTNYPASFAVEPLLLSISIDEEDMLILQGAVEEARARGVILPEGRPYVPAKLESEGNAFKAKLRIKGKMTDHVKGSKWSFRVIAKKDGSFLGMRRFSLQHPGTRNYISEWLAHQLMAGEGIIALRYGFIRVELNGEDLGIYAYEEHFGPELLQNNGRVEGPLFRFDPSLYWEHRLNEMRGERFEEAYASYQAAALDAFDSGALAKDTLARKRFEEAASLMEGFRRAGLKPSEVFDAERIARRHALLDLVGGYRSMDWSDVKFYYDPERRRIEPIAYESFSAFPITKLVGSGRWVGWTGPEQDLHDAYFNDEQVFRAYVHCLERISRTAYLDSVFQVLGPSLDTVSASVYREFPWKELDRSLLYRNQQVIRTLLDVPKGFHAYRQELRGDTLVLDLVPIESLPMEVHGLLTTDGSVIPPLGPTIVPIRRSGRPGDPVRVQFLVGGNSELPKVKDQRIRYSVLGASRTKEVEVFPYAFGITVKDTVPADGGVPLKATSTAP